MRGSDEANRAAQAASDQSSIDMNAAAQQQMQNAIQNMWVAPQ